MLCMLNNCYNMTTNIIDIDCNVHINKGYQLKCKIMSFDKMSFDTIGRIDDEQGWNLEKLINPKITELKLWSKRLSWRGVKWPNAKAYYQGELDTYITERQQDKHKITLEDHSPVIVVENWCLTSTSIKPLSLSWVSITW